MGRGTAALTILLLAATGGAAAGTPAVERAGTAAARAAPAEPSAAATRAPAERTEAAEAAGGTWPLEPPAVHRGFDPPALRWQPGHRGADLRGRVWQPVRAARGGVVRHAGPIAGRGVVVVGHGATRTTYEPVAASVAVGDRVRAGGVIGNLQLAGSHCLPAACLHWGWRRGETYLDPLALLGPLRVRLKPVDGPAGRPDAAGPW